MIRPRGCQIIFSDFQKIFYFTSRPNHFYTHCIPSHSEGRFAIVTSVGWDAVDAAALGVTRNRRAGWRKARERFASTQTNGAKAYGKTVWSWHPLLMSSWRRFYESNRVRQNR